MYIATFLSLDIMPSEGLNLLSDSERESGATTTFDLLPDEILLKILIHVPLPDLARVFWSSSLRNRRIRSLCRDRDLCENICVDKDWDGETARRIVLMAAPQMRRLSLKSTEGASALAIKCLESSDQLEELTCDHSDFTLAVMESLGKCSLASKLRLTATRSHLPFSTSAFIAGAANLRNLTYLDLYSIKCLDARSADLVGHIADNCRNLEYLDLPYRSLISDQTFSYVLQKVHKTLRGFRGSGEILTDVSLASLSLCRLLTYLYLFDTINLGIERLLEITDLGTTSLSITNAKKIAARDFVDAFAGSKTVGDLIFLNLSGCPGLDDVCLDVISRSCPRLRMLLLAGCGSRVGDGGVTSVLGRCQELEELWLGRTGVTGRAFEGVGSGASRLKRLLVDASLAEHVAKMMPRCHIIQSELDAEREVNERVDRLFGFDSSSPFPRRKI